MTNTNSEFKVGQVVQKSSRHPQYTEFFEVTEVHETHTVLRSLNNGYPEVDWHESELKRFEPANPVDLFEEYRSASADTNKFSKLYSQASTRKQSHAKAYKKLTGVDVQDVCQDGPVDDPSE